MLINLLFAPVVSLIWLIALGIFVTGFYISLRRSHTNWDLPVALVNIWFIFYQVMALMNARKANKISVATVRKIPGFKNVYSDHEDLSRKGGQKAKRVR